MYFLLLLFGSLCFFNYPMNDQQPMPDVVMSDAAAQVSMVVSQSILGKRKAEKQKEKKDGKKIKHDTPLSDNLSKVAFGAILQGLPVDEIIQKLNSLLLLGSSLNYIAKEKKQSCLHIAALKYDSAELIQLILKHNKSLLDMPDNLGKTALIIAIDNKHKAAYDALLAHGAYFDTSKYKNGTILHYAIDADDIELVEKIVKKLPALLEEKDATGDTPLAHAVFRGNSAIAKKLLNCGAKVKTKDKKGHTLLHNAVFGQNLEMIRWVLSIAPELLNKPNKRGETPLALAVDERFMNVVIELVSKGAATNRTDRAGNTLLHIAILNNNIEIINYFINDRFRALTNAQNNQGRTPLMLAAILNQLETVQHLLACGASPFMGDENGLTYLHHAAAENNDDILKFAFDNYNESTIDIIRRVFEGYTPLMEAVVNENYEAAKLLIEMGSSLDVEDDSTNDTALSHAVRKGNERIIELLILNGAKLTTKALEIAHIKDHDHYNQYPEDAAYIPLYTKVMRWSEEYSLGRHDRLIGQQLPSIVAQCSNTVQDALPLRIPVRTVDGGIPAFHTGPLAIVMAYLGVQNYLSKTV